MSSPKQVLKFWLDDVDEKSWYMSTPDFDAEITEKFLGTWNDIMSGAHSLWLTYPSGTLAYILVADQFSRNMFRGTSKSFASDAIALAAAKAAISRGWDMRIDPPARQFFYLPLSHSESLCDQDRAVRLIHTRMPDPEGKLLLHARAHREVIRQFGRFPYRNAALGRADTAQETKYLAQGGYGFTVNSMAEAA